MVENVGLEPTRLRSCKDRPGAHAHPPKLSSALRVYLVPVVGVEPTRLSAAVSKTAVSTVSPHGLRLVGQVGFEPTSSPPRTECLA